MCVLVCLVLSNHGKEGSFLKIEFQTQPCPPGIEFLQFEAVFFTEVIAQGSVGEVDGIAKKFDLGPEADIAGKIEAQGLVVVFVQVGIGTQTKQKGVLVVGRKLGTKVCRRLIVFYERLIVCKMSALVLRCPTEVLENRSYCSTGARHLKVPCT